MELSNIGVIGLGVMGQSLARNIAGKGFRVSVYNRPHPDGSSPLEKFMRAYGEGNFFATDNIRGFVSSLALPRKIILMVNAGSAVDEVVSQLTPLLSKGDIIIDGGNSDFRDTERRIAQIESQGFFYVGAGISGGEEGALKGPSIMPSGSPAAWPSLKAIFKRIAAVADDGEPCCRWIGAGGSGHFVKTVHNAIEYADMQLIAESYDILKRANGLSNAEIADVFAKWNSGELDSYLIEITANIFRAKESDGSYLVDNILDAASQKGTGKWAVQASLDVSEPLGLISQAVYARFVSAKTEVRATAAELFKTVRGGSAKIDVDRLGGALFAAKVISYAQGFSLMRAVSEKYSWNINYSAVAKIWRKGCIIRSAFLDKIAAAFSETPKLECLLFAPCFADICRSRIPDLRGAVAASVGAGVPLPCMASALAAFDSLASERLPANLIQAQRDYFGAHTYERVDAPRGEIFHTDWSSFQNTSAEDTGD